MNSIGKLFALLSCLVLLASCGTSKYGGATSLCDPDMSQLGPETYFARGNCSGANYAISAANSFCAQRGKASLIKNITGNDAIFRCLAPNDPEYKRPDYQKSPNIVIQNK